MSDLESVKKLRSTTGAGFKDCNSALKEASGNLEKAVEILRIKGISKASKKMSREANEGLVSICGNEKQTSIIQRRGILASKNLNKDTIIKKQHMVFLRPCKLNALPPYMFEKLLGRKTKKKINFHEVLNFKNTK